jgi:Ca-activated chloride channel family protein
VARLTALALGELTPAEAAALEASIWRDTDARLEVEKTRALAEQLTFAYAAEPPTTLTPAQHRAILERSTRLTGTDEKEARLTAYALGELRPSQAEALSARIAEDRAATLELEAVGALAALLRTAFAEEPVQLLSLEQRQAVLDRGYRQPEVPPAPAIAELVDTPKDTPVSVRPRLWLRTAALAAGFATLGYLANTYERPSTAVVVTTPDDVPAAHDNDFFPPRPLTSSPASPQLRALLDREKRRPSAGTAMNAPRETQNAESTTTPTATTAAAAEATPAPRRQPDESVLPPPRKTLAQGNGPRSLPAADTLLHTPLTAQGAEPLAGFLATADVATATVPTDLGRAGYDVVRQCIRDFGTLPPAALVRPEELINQFEYDVQPAPGQDFAVAIEAADCPWNESHQLVRVTVAAREAEPANPPLRLTVFMRLAESPESERAQLLAWQGLQALAARLRPADSISLAVWGRAHGLVLPATSVADVENLRDAPTRWHLGGSVLGPNDWATAEQALLRQATDNSRNVCLILTDGPLDFSGLTLAEAAQRLRTMGAEMAVAELGPLRHESRAAALADLASAPFFRADSGPESARLLAREILSSRTPVAEDVQLQVAFNPSALAAWRPIGFGAASRQGDATAPAARTTPWIAGRQLTALYEVVPNGAAGSWPQTAVYASPAPEGTTATAAPVATPPLSVRLHYRVPRTTTPRTVTTDWTASAGQWRTASPDFRLAAGAAAFALRLQDDHALRALPISRLSEWVRLASSIRDDFGLRREFSGMLDAVERLENAE